MQMGARLYNAETGRFMSADSLIKTIIKQNTF